MKPAEPVTKMVFMGAFLIWKGRMRGCFARLEPLFPDRCRADFVDEGGVHGGFCVGQARRQRVWPRPGTPIRGGLRRPRRGLHDRVKAEIWLTTADEFKINFGQQFGIEQGAVFFAAGIVNAKAAAERVKRGRRAGEFAAGHHQRIGGAAHGQSWAG